MLDNVGWYLSGPEALPPLYALAIHAGTLLGDGGTVHSSTCRLGTLVDTIAVPYWQSGPMEPIRRLATAASSAFTLPRNSLFFGSVCSHISWIWLPWRFGNTACELHATTCAERQDLLHSTMPAGAWRGECARGHRLRCAKEQPHHGQDHGFPHPLQPAQWAA